MQNLEIKKNKNANRQESENIIISFIILLIKNGIFKISNNKNGKRHKLQYSMLTNNKNVKFMSIKTNKF